MGYNDLFPSSEDIEQRASAESDDESCACIDGVR
jgi:hypothetical protein